MTILFAAALSDCVVMMADGRRAMSVAVRTDVAEKVLPLNDRLTLAVGGAQAGTDYAAGILRNGVPDSAPGIERHLTLVTRLAVQHVMNQLSPEAIAQTSVDVALLVAGFDAGGPFIVGGAHSNRMTAPIVLNRQVSLLEGEQFVVWGGEDSGARAYFLKRLLLEVRRLGDQAGQRVPLIEAILLAGKQTIDHLSRRHAGIGGQMQFRVVFPDQEPITGFR